MSFGKRTTDENYWPPEGPRRPRWDDMTTKQRVAVHTAIERGAVTSAEAHGNTLLSLGRRDILENTGRNDNGEDVWRLRYEAIADIHKDMAMGIFQIVPATVGAFYRKYGDHEAGADCLARYQREKAQHREEMDEWRARRKQGGGPGSPSDEASAGAYFATSVINWHFPDVKNVTFSSGVVRVQFYGHYGCELHETLCEMARHRRHNPRITLGGTQEFRLHTLEVDYYMTGGDA